MLDRLQQAVRKDVLTDGPSAQLKVARKVGMMDGLSAWPTVVERVDVMDRQQ